MDFDVVVVGGGIGGLTAAALLSARGLNVCLLERESQVGGCVAPFEKFGYQFDSTDGLFALWGTGDIQERIFAELPVNMPEARQLEVPYHVRISDGSEIPIVSGASFTDVLRVRFPECDSAAIQFYDKASRLGDLLLRSILKSPAFLTNNNPQLSSAETVQLIGERPHAPADQFLGNTSSRFRQFVDAQLQLLGQTTSGQCSYPYAAMLLALRSDGLFSIRGGAAAVAFALAQSIKSTGGILRLNAPALRLLLDPNGKASGVVLLSGESVIAKLAVISNLTVWDTYGKLLGLNNTPSEIRSQLSKITGSGVYLAYLGLDDNAATGFSKEHFIAMFDSPEDDPLSAIKHLTLSSSPSWDPGAPSGKRAAVLHTTVDVKTWFSFHEDESQHETMDQEMLEVAWARLQTFAGELIAGAEVIETATPHTYYESTRRKLGMVGGVSDGLAASLASSHRTPIPNLYRVGDTAFPSFGLLGASVSALLVANELTPLR